MARGTRVLTGTITTNTDTSVVPAGSQDERVYILWMTFTVQTAGTTSAMRVEDGAGGDVMGRLKTETQHSMLHVNYSTGLRHFPGRLMTALNALNVNTSGGAAATINYDIGIEVR